ncbi:MAG: hypothetical protein LBE44_03660 [Microbacterium hominis]|jgi:hypothetical protein|nr:hypothetical protein [Microbacterium hominis]
MEGEVFAQAAAIDRLLSLMHTLRARGEDFADNEELTVSCAAVAVSAPPRPGATNAFSEQDLYNSSMALRPKVVQLIRKYDQKQGESLAKDARNATTEADVAVTPSRVESDERQGRTGEGDVREKCRSRSPASATSSW